MRSSTPPRTGQAVADGRLTQAQADQLAGDLTEDVTTAVEQGMTHGGPGHHGPFGAPEDGAGTGAPDDGAATDSGTAKGTAAVAAWRV
jgi:hypothetical protein